MSTFQTSARFHLRPDWSARLTSSGEGPPSIRGPRSPAPGLEKGLPCPCSGRKGHRLRQTRSRARSAQRVLGPPQARSCTSPRVRRFGGGGGPTEAPRQGAGRRAPRASRGGGCAACAPAAAPAPATPARRPRGSAPGARPAARRRSRRRTRRRRARTGCAAPPPPGAGARPGGPGGRRPGCCRPRAAAAGARGPATAPRRPAPAGGRSGVSCRRGAGEPAPAPSTHLSGTGIRHVAARTPLWPRLRFWNLLGRFNLEREPSRGTMACWQGPFTYSLGRHGGLGGHPGRAEPRVKTFPVVRWKGHQVRAGHTGRTVSRKEAGSTFPARSSGRWTVSWMVLSLPSSRPSHGSPVPFGSNPAPHMAYVAWRPGRLRPHFPRIPQRALCSGHTDPLCPLTTCGRGCLLRPERASSTPSPGPFTLSSRFAPGKAFPGHPVRWPQPFLSVPC